jgi:hypothetical protein
MFNASRFLLCLFAVALIGAAAEADGQTRKRKQPPAKNPVAVAATPAPVPEPETKSPVPNEKTPEKKNARAQNDRPPAAVPQPEIGAGASEGNGAVSGRSYHYEFVGPSFALNHVKIEHDAAGRGSITFSHRGSNDTVTEPIALSEVTLGKINAALDALDFLNSAESYQHPRDYSHMGTATIRVADGPADRTASFNWTLNKDAKTLADEYRRIGYQYVWIFEISLARSNQPLEAPGLMIKLESYIRRGEISDPRQMLPLLESLINEERIPLIARNHAARLIKQIEKAKK